MSGHNKWSKIKRAKGAEDAKRGVLFTKLVKAITLAARDGGGDIEANPSLRVAVNNAKSASMPLNTIKRAIDKGSGNLEGVSYMNLSYEGYGPFGVAFMIETITDNKNRTIANIRQIMSKNGGTIGENGCVSWMFQRKGIIVIVLDSNSEKLIDTAVENGAFEMNEYDEVIVFETEPSDFNSCLKSLDTHKADILESKIELVPSNYVELNDEENIEQIENLVEKLEEDDDVSAVYTNMGNKNFNDD